MKTENRQFDKQGGSALILVVVVTVLLAVVGVMFLMVARASEMETGAVIQSKNLDDAVDTVIARINEVLVEDLFGNNNIIVDNLGGSDEPYDAVRMEDRWLASLEPTWSNDNGTPADPSDDNYVWAQFSRIFSPWGISLPAEICQTSIIPMVADADGDGVTDSGWEQVPGLTTSRGKPVFAAVRIIDNCAMLNLNAAHCFYQDSYATDVSPFMTPWYTCVDDGSGSNYDLQIFHDNQDGSGRYLTEINYLPFLRGHDLNGDFLGGATTGDNWTNIMLARGMTTVGTVTGFVGSHDVPALPDVSQNVFMNVESPISGFQFFDIGDELELRNRYLVTSKVEARFEQDIVANYTLDSGNGAGGAYAALEVPRDATNDFGSWKRRINPVNFDKFDPVAVANNNEYEYDRRHVCTVYSYDRTLNGGQGPLLYATLMTDGWTREQIADTQQSIFWYPLLYSELKSATWMPAQIIDAQSIFWPVGPVTTDIRVPVELAPGTWTYYNSTETRKRILHLLFAFREYFYDHNGNDIPAAAKSAAQVIANLVDYSDDDSPATTPNARQGPFNDVIYGNQANVDCTFITEQIIEDMIEEISAGLLPVGSYDFGLTETVFGYEKQPFISEVYVNWDAAGGGGLLEIAVELINPYSDNIDLQDWVLRVGDTQVHQFLLNEIVPAYDTATSTAGRAVVMSGATGGPGLNYTMSTPSLAAIQANFFGENSVAIQLLREDPSTPGSYYVIDQVSDEKIRETGNEIMGVDGQNALKRDDTNWGYIFAEYVLQREVDVNFTLTLGQDNAVTVATPDNFQIGIADDGLSLTRWHELEVLGLYGNGPDGDPNVNTVSSTLADPSTSLFHFDLAGGSSDLLDYIATVNRPDLGTLPGRININTAPVHVIAAAIPPTLADPNAADPAETVTFSALQLAQAIVTERQANGAYTKLSDLLSRVPRMEQYAGSWEWADPDADNVGMQSIEDDIEEEHWILSNLANKFTVRSDVFTAYILVRLGQEGPQRRMIAIFDRSQVWDKNDRPKLVALHPVPDPR